MLRSTLTQSAKNLPLSINGAEDTKIGNGTSSITRSAENLSASVDIAEDSEVGKCDGSDDEIVERSALFKKPNGPIRNLISLCFGKRWVSLDGFGYSWGSQLQALFEWLRAKFAGLLAQRYKEQSSCWATQSSHPNQSLQKLTLHRYNKLSFLQVCRTYEFSWYHFTSIIKL